MSVKVKAMFTLIFIGLFAQPLPSQATAKQFFQDTATQAQPGTRCTRLSRPREYGRLEVVSQSERLQVILDNDNIGTTTKRRRQTVGQYSLKVSKATYEDFTSTVFIEKDKTVRVSCALSEQPHKVNCVVSPE